MGLGEDVFGSFVELGKSIVKETETASTILKNIKSGPAVTNLAMNGGLVIQFKTPRDLSGIIAFPSFLTSFSDRVTANFTDTNVYARMDPIYSYQNTTREITFSFDVVAQNEEEAALNLRKIKTLQDLLYPTFVGTGGGVQILTAPPFFQVKIGNLVEDKGGSNGFLLGVIDTFDYSPDFGPGMFTEGGAYLPKVYSINCNFKPVHSTPRGHKDAAGSRAANEAEILANLEDSARAFEQIVSGMNSEESSGAEATVEGNDIVGGSEIEFDGASSEISNTQAGLMMLGPSGIIAAGVIELFD